ncbi:MAG: hypothetical protein E4H36_11615 [Spirochaetales bacterium]|nr:MAG: hypothetical protein E4H36_11615 [Spirochaetales bacterium]
MTVSVLVSLAACSRGGGVKSPSTAVIEYFEGEVTVNGRTPELGQTLLRKFSVKTGSGAYCGIIFDKKNIMHVDENTTAVIDLSGLQKKVELSAGSLGSALRNLPKQLASGTDSFMLTSPSAVAGIRGTVFYVRVEDGNNTYICDCNGIVHMRDIGKGNERTVEATHHAAYRYTRGGGAITSAQADMLYHSDQMMELGAARIGETIDWTRVER